MGKKTAAMFSPRASIAVPVDVGAVGRLYVLSDTVYQHCLTSSDAIRSSAMETHGDVDVVRREVTE